jgi:hypothetical protein
VIGQGQDGGHKRANRQAVGVGRAAQARRPQPHGRSFPAIAAPATASHLPNLSSASCVADFAGVNKDHGVSVADARQGVEQRRRTLAAGGPGRPRRRHRRVARRPRARARICSLWRQQTRVWHSHAVVAPPRPVAPPWQGRRDGQTQGWRTQHRRRRWVPRRRAGEQPTNRSQRRCAGSAQRRSEQRSEQTRGAPCTGGGRLHALLRACSLGQAYVRDVPACGLGCMGASRPPPPVTACCFWVGWLCDC